ncbi:hypothetical protein L1286_16940 [Pseudoalteromonas sp. SMS1]|uniref:hypothetical protein n=1 Tax=Pseudoalteromonas sp. SMS1 TaxID=2908894 RepID=UPI001F276315|nr:hypothetical protein [Pseudoalteromonas sp. SMS1]MCF2859172.1 hypothetical protein [Pseudoalteromonas sp. SMS1]
MEPKMIGGWSQFWDVPPPSSFSYAIYGMITSLETLTNPGNKSPNHKPNFTQCDLMWAYGGGGCSPSGYPLKNGIADIVNASVNNQWHGVDFDDECYMNTSNIITAMTQLKSHSIQSSYTFLAGADYVNLGSGVQQVKEIVAANCCDRFCLMCYGAEMWSMQDINQYVDKAIKQTIEITGDKSKVILALTPAGLNDDNLNVFLNAVVRNDIGGLFIWEFKNLPPKYLDTIVTTLGIAK